MTMTPEQLIYDLQSQVIRLEQELEQAHRDIRDFELLAVEWKKGYAELERKHRVGLINMKQIIDELQYELDYINEDSQ